MNRQVVNLPTGGKGKNAGVSKSLGKMDAERDVALRNEEYIIASILKYPGITMSVSIKPEDMLRPLAKQIVSHKKIYPEADWESLTLDRNYSKEEAERVQSWMNKGSTNSPIELKRMTQRVKNYSKRMNVVRSIAAARDKIVNGSDIDKVMAELTMSNMMLSEDEYRSASDVIKDTVDRIDYVKKNGVDTIFVRSGFWSFDEPYIGFERRACHILAGRPGMGKTAFVTQLAEQVAKKQVVAIHTLEMDGESLALRSLSRRSNNDIRAIRTGLVDGTDFDAACQDYSKLKLFIDDCPSQDISHIEAAAYRLKSTKGLDLMIVDYLGLMSHSGEINDETRIRIGKTTKGLRRLAKELDFAVILLCQLNRGVESRMDKRPTSADLRDSGEIEQDADSIMMLYRDSVYNDKADPSAFELISTKQRNGPIGAIKTIDWNPSTASFVDRRNHVKPEHHNREDEF